MKHVYIISARRSKNGRRVRVFFDGTLSDAKKEAALLECTGVEIGDTDGNLLCYYKRGTWQFSPSVTEEQYLDSL